MKAIVSQARKRRAFTIVELLTVMSIIVILIGLLVPALNKVKIYAMGVKQRAQFHSIEAALELFSNEFDGYPDSSALDPLGNPYCGAMKLCEAMMGWDLLGFHRDSGFIREGARPGVTPLTQLYYPDNLSSRRGPFLPLESANAYRLDDLYPTTAPNLTNFRMTAGWVAAGKEYPYVLCDVYAREMSKVKAGMPVLYYRANTSNSLHYRDTANVAHPPVSATDPAGNIYNSFDNQQLLDLRKPWVTGTGPESLHTLATVEKFYENTKSHLIDIPWRPYMSDRFILISAGYDNEYGTADDICNYEWKTK